MGIRLPRKHFGLGKAEGKIETLVKETLFKGGGEKNRHKPSKKARGGGRAEKGCFGSKLGLGLT